MSIETLALLTPEIVLAATAVLVYVGGAFVDARSTFSWIAAGGIIVAAAALWTTTAAAAPGGPVAADQLAYYGRWLALAVGILFVLMTSRGLSTPGTSEYVGSLLLVTVGMMLVAGASELVLLFLALELVSIPTYILLYLGRRDAASQEAAAKYFFLSILASALLLYGFSFLYGAAGSTDLGAIAAVLRADDPGFFDPRAKVALVLIFAALAFKIAAVPFHFYAPDVYQGTTNPNAGLLAVVPKIAGVLALLRLVVIAMPEPGLEVCAWRIAMVLAVLTMTLGNVMALWQDNIRRLLAYSSIAHAGYMLVGLSVGLYTRNFAAGPDAPASFNGIGAMLFYLCVYALGSIGAFSVLVYLGRDDKQIDGVDELAGLGRTCPIAAAAMAVFMFSLAGIPPLAGFWGKFTIFASALTVDISGVPGTYVRPWFVGLAVIGMLNAAIAAAYYLRVIGVMYFRLPLATPKIRPDAGARFTMVFCALLTIAVGFFPAPLIRESDEASPTAAAAAEDAQSTSSPRSRSLGATTGRDYRARPPVAAL